MICRLWPNGEGDTEVSPSLLVAPSVHGF